MLLLMIDKYRDHNRNLLLYDNNTTAMPYYEFDFISDYKASTVVNTYFKASEGDQRSARGRHSA